MKSGSYIVRFYDEGEDATIEVIGGISSLEVAQLFGFCVSYLLDIGTDYEELKGIVDLVEEERGYVKLTTGGSNE